jgi:hypothetical protein
MLLAGKFAPSVLIGHISGGNLIRAVLKRHGGHIEFHIDSCSEDFPSAVQESKRWNNQRFQDICP